MTYYYSKTFVKYSINTVIFYSGFDKHNHHLYRKDICQWYVHK